MPQPASVKLGHTENGAVSLRPCCMGWRGLGGGCSKSAMNQPKVVGSHRHFHFTPALAAALKVICMRVLCANPSARAQGAQTFPPLAMAPSNFIEKKNHAIHTVPPGTGL